MYQDDLPLLRCPTSGDQLSLVAVTQTAEDGEILEGTLGAGDKTYPIRNGIPRFVSDMSSNPTWDFKWRVLDAGRGLNYRIIDKNDPAYTIHDIYDRNSHEGAAYRRMKGGLVLDIGCGVGQYAIKSLLEHDPAKLVAVDLTGGVDVFRKIVRERYPQFIRRLLIVQASVFELPLAEATFDYVYSLGVLMHTGDTLRALDRACAMVKEGGEINVWIYGSEALAYNAVEPGRAAAMSLATVQRFIRQLWFPMYWIRLFRRIPHDRAVRIVTFFSSERIYQLGKRPYFKWIPRVFPTVDHADYDYRLINNYDGYVNTWDDTWSEHELFPVLRRHSIALKGIGSWRVGLWGRKTKDFYPAAESEAVPIAPTFSAVGYPKVGNTWLRITLGRYLAERYALPTVPLMEAVEFSTLAAAGSKAIGEFTHSPLEWTTQAASDLSYDTVVRPFLGRRVVLLTRYPLDTLVSLYMQERFRNPQSVFKGSMADFINHPVFGLDKLIRFHQIWEQGRRDVDVLLWKYEDALANGVDEFNRVLEFLGEPIDAAIAARAVAGASFENLRALEVSGQQPKYKSSDLPIFATGDLSNQNALHNRRGVAGGYREEIPAELIKALEERIARDMPDWYRCQVPPPPAP